jgi:hypothetical protein
MKDAPFARPTQWLGEITRSLLDRHRIFSNPHGVLNWLRRTKLIISALATALVASFAVSAEAAGNKHKVSADVQTSCKAQAAKKYAQTTDLKAPLRRGLRFLLHCYSDIGDVPGNLGAHNDVRRHLVDQPGMPGP